MIILVNRDMFINCILSGSEVKTCMPRWPATRIIIVVILCLALSGCVITNHIKTVSASANEASNEAAAGINQEAGDIILELVDQISPEYPPFIFRLYTKKTENTTINRIRIFKKGAKEELVQEIIYPLDYFFEDASRNFGLVIEDMNFDGYKDFRIRAISGGARNNPFSYCWIYDPVQHKYLLNEELEEIISPQVDHENKMITSRSNGSSGISIQSFNKWVDGHIALIKEIVENRREKDAIHITTKEWKISHLTITKYDEPLPPAGDTASSDKPAPPAKIGSEEQPVLLKTFRGRVHPSLPEYNFRVYGYGSRVYYVVTKIVVVKPGEPEEIIQELIGDDNHFPVLYCDVPDPGFYLEDVNFDDYNDVRIMPSDYCYFWTFDPAQNKFVYNKELSNAGITLPTVDSATKTIISRRVTRDSHFEQPLYIFEKYFQFIDRHITPVKKITRTVDRENKVVHVTVKELTISGFTVTQEDKPYLD